MNKPLILSSTLTCTTRGISLKEVRVDRILVLVLLNTPTAPSRILSTVTSFKDMPLEVYNYSSIAAGAAMCTVV